MTNFSTDFCDGQLALLNELIDFIEANPTAQNIRKDFIAPKCKSILAQIKIEKELINGYAEGVNEVLNAVPDNGKSLFETLGECFRPENINNKQTKHHENFNSKRKKL